MGESVPLVCNNHLRKSFSSILGNTRDTELEWTMEAADKYRLASMAAARAVAEAKTRVWKEFGEAMETYFLTVLKAILANRQISPEREAVLSTDWAEPARPPEDVVGWRKEHLRKF